MGISGFVPFGKLLLRGVDTRGATKFTPLLPLIGLAVVKFSVLLLVIPSASRSFVGPEPTALRRTRMLLELLEVCELVPDVSGGSTGTLCGGVEAGSLADARTDSRRCLASSSWLFTLRTLLLGLVLHPLVLGVGTSVIVVKSVERTVDASSWPEFAVNKPTTVPFSLKTLALSEVTATACFRRCRYNSNGVSVTHMQIRLWRRGDCDFWASSCLS